MSPANCIPPIVTKQGSNEGDEIKCPICCSGHVYPSKLRCNPAGNVPGALEVCKTDIRLTLGEMPKGRGVEIEIIFQCEQGHAFTLHMHFHKGASYLRVARRPYLADNSEVIWRD